MTGAAIAALAGAAWYGCDYWTVGQYLVSTDDAYVQADNTTIAPKVSGYLHQVLVGDNERVKAGQVLARIDDRDFKVALDQAKADVAAAEAAIASKQAQLDVQQAVIDAAKATVDVDSRGEDVRRARRTSATPISPRPVTAACRTRNRRSRATPAPRPRSCATPPTSPPPMKQVDLLKAEIAQAGRGARRARPRCNGRPSSISATPRSSRRSTASSATARCASASSCRPARN